MLPEAEYARITAEIRELMAKHNVRMIDALVIFESLGIETAAVLYKLDPVNYKIIQDMWDEMASALPRIPSDRGIGVGIA